MSKSCVTFFVWKVSNLGLISLLFFFMDCVQSWGSVLFAESVQSWGSVLFAESVQSWSRHQNCKEDWIGYTHWYRLLFIGFTYRYSSQRCRKSLSWSRHQNCKRIGLGTKISATILSSLWVYLSLVPQDVMAPELQEVSPLPIYINLDLYSGFWCTSHCVVFKHSVPPLTDQALRKVLLTSWKKLTIVVWWVSGLLNVLFSWYTVMIQVQ